MWKRAFERAFLRLRSEGVSEDSAIALAESEANDGLDRYWDDKIEEWKENGRNPHR